MAFLLNKASIASHFRSQPLNTEGAFSVPRRRFHVDLGAREKALLAEDPYLMRFKSEKKAVKQIKRVGDVLTIIVLTGCCYEVYARTGIRGESHKQAGGRE